MFTDDIRRDALKYLRYKDMFSYITKEVMKELHEYVEREFAAIPVPVIFVNTEVDCTLMTTIFEKDSCLVISTLHNNSRLFPGELNLKMRAIHDYVHLTKNYGCDYEGEYLTYEWQSKGLSEQAKKVMRSEIVLQAAFCLYFGFFPDFQKVILS